MTVGWVQLMHIVLSEWDVSPYPAFLSGGKMPKLIYLKCKVVVSHISVASTL